MLLYIHWSDWGRVLWKIKDGNKPFFYCFLTSPKNGATCMTTYCYTLTFLSSIKSKTSFLVCTTLKEQLITLTKYLFYKQMKRIFLILSLYTQNFNFSLFLSLHTFSTTLYSYFKCAILIHNACLFSQCSIRWNR